MERHEKGCTLNPDRVCGWSGGTLTNAIELGGRLKAEWLLALDKAKPYWSPPIDIPEEVRQECHDGCPICILTALRLSGERGNFNFNLEEEVKAWKETEDSGWQ